MDGKPKPKKHLQNQLNKRANTAMIKEDRDLSDFIQQTWGDYAPSWANYLAITPDGKSYWYEFEPRVAKTGWVSVGGKCQSSTILDWYRKPNDLQKSLHQRPN